MTEPTPRRTLFRWIGWFALANALVFGVVSLRYFSGGVQGLTPVAAVYLVSVYIGHHVLLTTVPLFLLAAPLAVFWPRRRALTLAGVVLFALMIAVMLLDSLLWSQSRFHLNGLTAKILGWQSWAFAAVFFLIALVFESLLARSVWNWVQAKKGRHGVAVGLFCGLMVMVSQGIHAWADASYYLPVTRLGQQLPVYKGITAKSWFTRTGLVDVKESRERQLARRVAQGLEAPPDRVLNYPLHPLQCHPDKKPNLLIILADAMRGDMLNDRNAPETDRFAREHAMNFRNHFSGGNSSRMGVFSLFYGLPPVYWSSFEGLQRPSVMIDELQRQGYQFGIFSSSTLYRPVALDRTAFARVPNLRIGTEPASDPSWKRDRKATREWRAWLDARDPGRPFFGFLFYDSTTVRKYPPDYPVRFEPPPGHPMAEQFATYETAVHFVDSQIGEVLDDLERRGLLENTVVLISADHGEEFGESGVKLTKHGSGYTRYQLGVPMVLAWPGRQRGVSYDHRTSHYDVVPTVMKELLGCSNPPSDYAVGHDLFDMQPWDWILAGSYYNYALLEPDQITITFPNGMFEVRDWNYRPLDKPVFRGGVLEDVAEQNARYFR